MIPLPVRLFRRLAGLALAAGVALGPAVARAEFATTNLQLLHGWNFHDPSVAEDVKGGQLSTLTLNHFSTWKYGDTFAFVDLLQGKLTDGVDSRLYAEVHPRLFLNRLLGANGTVLGIFKDAGIATELNLGNGFQAWLAGLGGDFANPWGTITLNVYYRYTSLQVPAFGVRQHNHTWQVSPAWVLPFALGKVPLLFAGFVDVDGVKAGKGWKGYEVMAQPQLLVDVLALSGGPKNVLLLGVEWYLHYHSANESLGAPTNLVSAPQALVQWTLH